MHQQFNIQQLYALPTLYLCVLYLRTNSVLSHLQLKLISFYDRDGKCLQRGTGWVFKWNDLLCVFKGLITFLNIWLVGNLHLSQTVLWD
jgi:hypothetical protein